MVAKGQKKLSTKFTVYNFLAYFWIDYMNAEKKLRQFFSKKIKRFVNLG